MALQLRQYQLHSVYLLNRAINGRKNPICVLPTGAGKSLVLAELLRQRDERALVLSHVAELLEQDSLALRNLAPQIEQSFFSAKLGQKKLGTQVVFGSVQSVVRSLDAFRKHRPLVMIDEAHLCPRKADAMYAQVFQHFSMSARVGFTATPLRLDSGSLVEGEGAWFDSIAHEVPFPDLVAQGYLLPLVGVIAEQQANLEGVAERGGEFALEDAQEAVMRTLSLPDAVAQACSLARRRKSWLIFAAGIEHAGEIEKELRSQGIDVATITGKTPTEERGARIAAFRAGALKALVNVGVLTTGFDAPMTDCIISMRPTQSPVLWQQMLGRGVRLSPGKTNCLVLDFVGNLDRLGGADMVQEVKDFRAPGPKRGRKAPAKVTRKRKAPVFFDASNQDPMVTGSVFDAKVQATRYIVVNSRNQPGKKLLLATYVLEDQFGRTVRAQTFVPVEYGGGARYAAVKWFEKRGIPETQVPSSADQAAILAYASLQPIGVVARFDQRIRAVVVERERF